MKRQFAGLSDQGLVRSANQDSYCLDDPEGRFFVVADGMGGHAGGEEASRIATQAIRTYLCEHWGQQPNPAILLEGAMRAANEQILDNQQTHPERADMGTTAVVVIFPADDQPWCAHVGDSRLYRFRQTQLEQITEDHTWISQAVKAGLLNLEQARNHPWRHVLAQCLGRAELTQIDIQPLHLEIGDRLLLCSDGLTEELPDAQISPYLTSTYSCYEAAEALVEAAKEEGGQDNITVVIIGVDELEDEITWGDSESGPRTMAEPV